MLELIDKVSLAFGHVTRLFFLGMFFIVTAVVAASSYVLLVLAPFEYSYGQDDLAFADLIALALLTLASWRYFHRGRQSQTPLWPLLKRFTFTLTFVTLLLLSALGVFASMALVEPTLATEQLSGGGDDLLLYSIFCIFIVAIYGATPLPALSGTNLASHKPSAVQKTDDNESDRFEAEPPTLSPSTDRKS
ncbi:hypothetical protein [Marinobacter sp. Arc7-DN-1]|uniref:hypothetical protein n=1 Tax=Marinobacter sp. Arc7-DN-1 TaxID=2304594 RepID=UPI000E433EB1|nr:hypothetical protein [Marinobacter sp. Arc7-DN-1]AXS81900.1 hypothetical protein D0851_01890 [Marinobacter sp. Arc7-DN-1]